MDPTAPIRAYLSIQIKKIKGKEANSNLNIFDFHVFPFTLTELLERHKFPCRLVYSDSFRIKNE